MSSKQIDERVVEMRFDNQHFEKNVQTSMSTLDKFKQKLQFKDASKGFEDIDRAAKKTDLSPLAKSAEKVGLKFNAMFTAADQALRNIVNSAQAAGERIVKALTVDPIKTGLQEYEIKMNAVQVIKANTRGKDTMDDITSALEELNEYADKTIYNFAQMTSNVGKFTAQGFRAKEAANAVKGLANLAAASGASAEDMARATYQMSQALGGIIRTMDWNSLKTANMATVDLKNTLMDLARVNGIAIDDMLAKHGTFELTLQEGWLSGKMFTEAMNIYSGIYSEAELKAKGFTDEQVANFMDLSKMAESAATEVKTFTQLFDVLKETAQSGWTQTWEIIFGDFDTAKDMFTKLQVYFGDILNAFSDARNMLFGGAFNLKNPWSKIMEKLENSSIGKIANTFEKISSSVGDVNDKLNNFQKIVSDVWKGNYKNSDTGRYDLLEAAGYNHKVIQELVNKGADYKITVEDIEAAHKKFGSVLEENGKTAETTTVKFKDLTDEQLKQAGLTKDEIKLYRDLAEEAERTGVGMMTLVTEMSENDGRTMLIDSFKNAWSGLVSILKAVKDAWVEIFPPVTAVQLYNIIKSIKEFSEHLLVSDTTVSKLTRTFKGLFAILDALLTMAIYPLKAAFSIITKLLSAFNIDILSITAAIGDVMTDFGGYIDAVFKWIESLGDVSKSPKEIAQNIIDSFGKAFKVVIGWIGTLGIGLRDGFSTISGDILQGLINGLWNGIKRAGLVIVELGKILIQEFCDVLGIESPSKKFFELAGYVIEGFLNGITTYAPKVLNTLYKVGVECINTVTKLISKIDWGTVIAGVVTTISSISMLRITSAIKNISMAFKGFGDFMESVGEGTKTFLTNTSKGVKNFLTDIGSGAKSMLKDIGTAQKLKAFKNVAMSLVLLAGAIALLSLIPPERLLAATAALTVMGAVLGGLVMILRQNVSGKLKVDRRTSENFKHLAATLIGISTSLVILAAAVKILSTMSWSELGVATVGLIGIAGIVAALLVLVKNMNNVPAGNIGKTLGQLVIMTTFIAVLAGIVVLLSHMSTDKALSSVVALSMIMASMTGLMYILSSFKVNFSLILRGIGGLALMIAPLVAFAITLALIPKPKVDEKDILILTGVMTAMTALLYAVTPIGIIYKSTYGLAATGIAGLAAMVGPIWAFAATLAHIPPIVGKEKDIHILTGVMTAMTALLYAVTGVGAIYMLTYGIVATGIAGLAAMVGPIWAFAATLAYMPSLEGKEKDIAIMVGVMTAMTLLLAVLTVVGVLSTLALGGIVGLAAMVGPLWAFAASLSALPSLDGKEEDVRVLINVMTVMTGLLTILAVIGPLAYVGIGALTSLTSFMVGLGALTIAIGYLFENTSFERFLNGGIAVFEQLAYGLGSIVSKFTTGLLSNLPEMGSLLSDFMDEAKGFIEGIKMVDNQTLKGVGILVGTFTALGAIDGIALLKRIITGEKSPFESFGNGLSTLGTSLADFAAQMESFTDEDLAAVTRGAEAIKALAAAAYTIPNTGGVAGFFKGNNDIDAFISMLVGDPDNGKPGIKELSECLNAIEIGESFSDKVVSIAKVIESIGDAARSIPNTGSAVTWLVGDNAIDSFIAMLIGDGEKSGIKELIEELLKIDFGAIDTAASNIDNLKVIPEIMQGLADAASSIPNKAYGSVVGWFVGDNTIDSFINMLIGNGDKKGLKDLMTSLLEIDFGTSTTAIDNLKVIPGIMQGLADAASSIPNKAYGSVVGWFVGDNTIDSFINMLIGSGDKKGLKDLIDELLSIDFGTNETITAKAESIEATAAIIEAMSSASSAIKTLSTSASKIKSDNIEKFISAVQQLLDPENNFSADSITKMDGFSKALESIATNGIKNFSDIISSKTSVDSAKTAVKTLLSSATNGVKTKDLKQKCVDIGKYIAEGIATGIRDNTILVTNAARDVVNAGCEAAQDEGQINSPSKLYKNEVGRWICEGIAEGITENTSAEDALKIKMGNLYSAYLDLKKDWDGVDPLPSIYSIATSTGAVKVDREMRAKAKEAGMNIKEYVEHILAEAYVDIEKSKPNVGEKAAEAIETQFEDSLKELEAKKKKSTSSYNWSKVGSTFGLSDAIENEKKYLNEQISVNNELLDTYQKQINEYRSSTDIFTDEHIASIQEKMVALKEENAEYTKRLSTVAADQASKAAATLSEELQDDMDNIQRKLDIAKAKYENWVADYPNAKESVKQSTLLDFLNQELKLLKDLEKKSRDKVNQVKALTGSDSEEYAAAYKEWVTNNINVINKDKEITDTKQQFLDDLETADDNVRESEYNLWVARNEDATEQEKLARELEYLNASLLDAEEEVAKDQAEYLKILEREGETAAATLVALSKWNESEEIAAKIRNSIAANKKSSEEAAKKDAENLREATDALRESEYQLWVSENEDASDKVKLGKSLSRTEEKITEAQKAVFRAKKEYHDYLAEGEVDETKRLELERAINVAEKEVFDLQNERNDIEEKMLDLVREEQGLASDIAKLKYDIWENKIGRDADDSVKELKKIELLNEQLAIQKQITNAAVDEYNKILNDPNADSAERLRAQKEYLQEVHSLSELESEILDIQESVADRQKRLKDKQELASKEYDDYIKRYEKYYLANGMTKEDLERDAKLVSGYNPSAVVKDIVSETKTALETVTQSDAYNSVITGLNNMGSSYIDAVGEGVSSSSATIQNMVLNIATQCAHKLVEARPWWITAGKQLVSGLVVGIQNNRSAAINAAYQMAASMLAAAKRALDMHSPSKAFAEIGKYSVLGLVQGLVENTSLSNDAAARMGESAIESLKSSIRKISDVVNADLDTQPTIRPVLDLSNIRSGTARLNAMVSNAQAIAISDSRKAREHSDTNQNGNDTSTNTGNTYQFTQNNYSPKALSPTEIYRQTKNQFAAMKEVLS